MTILQGAAVVWILWVTLPVTVYLVTAAHYLAKNIVARRFERKDKPNG